MMRETDFRLEIHSCTSNWPHKGSFKHKVISHMFGKQVGIRAQLPFQYQRQVWKTKCSSDTSSGNMSSGVSWHTFRLCAYFNYDNQRESHQPGSHQLTRSLLKPLHQQLRITRQVGTKAEWWMSQNTHKGPYMVFVSCRTMKCETPPCYLSRQRADLTKKELWFYDASQHFVKTVLLLFCSIVTRSAKKVFQAADWTTRRSLCGNCSTWPGRALIGSFRCQFRVYRNICEHRLQAMDV